MLQKNFKRIALVVFAFVLMSFAVSYAQEYTFSVHNNTKNTIKMLLASEDGKKYGKFDVGDGIPPGQRVKLAWDKSTNDKGCHWYFKAVFDNDEQSDPVKFNFCEKDLELEF